MKRMVTNHGESCQASDNSRVLWDPDTGVTSCRECGAELEEIDTEEDGDAEGSAAQE
jgi:hypothetical protein